MPLPPDYPELLSRLDHWQDDVRQRFPGVVPCRAGCSACCHGPFDISAADALLVARTVAALPDRERESIERRARIQVERMEKADPGFRFPWAVSQVGEARFDALVESQAEDPCPALSEAGSCLIYPGRPMVCRLMGLGMRIGPDAVLENACPIREEFPEYRDLPPQEFDLPAWERDEAAALRSAGQELFGSPERSIYETTIAGAVLIGAR